MICWKANFFSALDLAGQNTEAWHSYMKRFVRLLLQPLHAQQYEGLQAAEEHLCFVQHNFRRKVVQIRGSSTVFYLNVLTLPSGISLFDFLGGAVSLCWSGSNLDNLGLLGVTGDCFFVFSDSKYCLASATLTILVTFFVAMSCECR